jgi:hypothetical protein
MANNALASGLIALLVLLPAGGVAAQSDAAKPAGIKVEQGTQPAPKADAKPMKTAAAGGKRKVVHMNDDARHCLEQPTVAEIIKCAEPFRY